MKKGLYRTLAWTGIRKNRKLYVPYLLTCAGMVMMCYIVSFLSSCPTFTLLRGGRDMQGILSLGFGVLSVFSVIFLFYTNSFLIRRRKREFGLYNILGLGKRHLAVVLLWETLFTVFIAFAGGMAGGILLSKLAELIILKMLESPAVLPLSVDAGSILRTLALFAAIFALLYLNALRQIQLANPIDLLRSENTGEKPPKANWLGAVLGLLLLGGAYYLAVTIADPVSTLIWFFVAVVMVIVGTYLLLISGSVALCRLLQKHKRFYYTAKHFVSVSSMAYRMKRNGAGLASICILCTMVLVMMSSTLCLYIGAEDSLRGRYPREINLTVTTPDPAMLESDQAAQLRILCEETAQKEGCTPRNVIDYRSLSLAGIHEGDTLVIDPDTESVDLSDVWQVFLVPLEDYNRLMGKNETLEPGEALCYLTKGATLGSDSLQIGEAVTLSLRPCEGGFVENGTDAMQIFPSLYLFVPNFNELVEQLGPEGIASPTWSYGFDTGFSNDAQIDLYGALREAIAPVQESISEDSYLHILLESRASERISFLALYGGLLFLGVLLGIVFLLAAVLILYYKQIVEGYEDQARFLILRKVGMTKRQIRKSINSQILLVFFLPLLLAGVHLAFAFPMIQKLLVLFSVLNVPLLLTVTACCFLLFSVFYLFVYRSTSRAYYTIVSVNENF